MNKIKSIQDVFFVIMKVSLTQMLIMALLTSVVYSAELKGQEILERKITLHLQHKEIKFILSKIEKQASVRFTYNPNIISAEKKISIQVNERKLEHVLEEIFGQHITYQLVGTEIVLKEMVVENPFNIGPAAIQNVIQVEGKVTDQSGQPIPGANVIEKGTVNGTSTDADGLYSLTVSETNAVLVFSFIGYESKEISVNGMTTIDVSLIEGAQSLEEVVVVGYGSKKKVNLTGAVDQVTSEALENRPITNVARGLQGLIPNLNIVNSGGNPNAEPTINIRGTTSINGSGPLVLVDNVQMNMNMVNPNDIESITVLKDAASSAIYGARGAFGVILITLKKGARNRQPVISYTGGMEFNKPTYLPDMLSSLEYMEATNLARRRRFGNVVYSDQQLEWARAHIEDPENNPSYHVQPNGSIFWHANVNNFDEMLQDVAPAQNHSLSVNGGSEKTSYYASLGYRKQEGMFRDATDIFKRYNFLLNLKTDVTDWLMMGFKVSYTNKNYDQPHMYAGKGSWWNQMTRGVPQILFPIRTPADAPIPNAPTAHYYNFLTSGSRNVSGTDVGLYSVNTEIDLVKGLKLKGDFNYQRQHTNATNVRKEFGFIRDKWEYQYNHTTPSYVQRISNQSDYFAANAYLTYDRNINNDHDLSALVGFNQEWMVTQNFNVTGNELITNEIPALSLATGEILAGDNESDWAIRGLFGRLTYSYKQKYLFEVNGRYDGTSRFPKNKRFHFFPSFSAGWRISEEVFMEGTRSFLDNLKLRASYGSLGNQNLGNAYPYITNFGVVNPINYLLGDELSLGLNPPGLVSPDLTWETSSTIDFGLDVSLFGKVSVSYDWYKRTTSDMLVAGEKLPAVLGINAPQRNGAELETIGGELSIKYFDETKYGLTYDVGVVVSNYQATITKYDNNPNKLHTTYYEGQKFGEIWGYETIGIFQTQDDVDAAADHSQLANILRQPGDIEFSDLNDDGIINFGDNTVDNPGDKKIIGNSTPRFQFGINGNFAWKGFDLRLFFQGTGKKDLYPTGNYFWGQINNAAAVGTNEVYYNSWSEENPGAYYPIYKQNSAFNIQAQTRYLQNGAYVRMKNLTFGYSLPGTFIDKINIQKVRLYFSGENLWEYSGLKGNFDPERTDGQLGVFYPLQRTLSFGLQIVL